MTTTIAKRESTMIASEDSPRIYVACLAAYNAGRLHGRWIDAVDADEVMEEVEAMLKESPELGAEEWAIHDVDGFHGIRIGEFDDIEKVAELGAAIEEHGEAFAAYAGHVGVDYATVEGFEEDFCGEWDSEEAYAEELFDELYGHDLPEHLANYIDYAAFARDLFCGDCFSVDSPAGVFVFRNS